MFENTKNYILQALTAKGFKPFYYSFENSRYEIDFIIQHKNEIIPIEAKSSENKNKASLNVYTENYEPKIRIRFSTRNLKKDDNLINIPLFMIEYLDKLLEL